MKNDNLLLPLVVEKCAFNSKAIEGIACKTYIKDHWPLVYILSSADRREVYVGESANAFFRFFTHLDNPKRNKLKTLHLITSPEFNKSATLDIEANLIKYLSGGPMFKVINGNLGLTLQNYYQKEEYLKLFRPLWEKLKREKIAFNNIREIENSNLFKYSPYKSLTDNQYESILEIIEFLTKDQPTTAYVQGGAGTGKTVLAIFLMKILVTDLPDLFDKEIEDIQDEKFKITQLKEKYTQPKIALVVPMLSLRNTLKNVFKGINGLKPSMVIGPSDALKKEYDILIVDEAHRLRKRKNITNYGSFDNNNRKLKLPKTATELDWIRCQSKKQILFYDNKQSVKPSDVDEIDFARLKEKSVQVKLKSQLRVKGGGKYISFVDKLLKLKNPKNGRMFKAENYEFLLFDRMPDLSAVIKNKEKEFGLCRIAAGYAWEWKSKKNRVSHDIEIDGMKLKWNTEFKEWINSKNAANEVGCIHTTQGYDLNYAGIIFGNEIIYNPKTKRIEIIADNFFDVKTKAGISNPGTLRRYIMNIYQTLMYRGIHGTYVYVCDPNLRAYFKKYIPTFNKRIV